MLTLENVSYYPNNSRNVVLDKINLRLEKGFIYTIVGVNGAGKSSLLDLISGLKKPTSGKISFNDTNIHDNKKTILKHYDNVGYCIQDVESSFFNKTVGDEFLFSGVNVNDSTSEFLSYWKPFLSYSPFQLSGGQKKKLLLTLITLNNPAIILADEFSAGLDVNNKMKLWELLREKRTNSIIVTISHDILDSLIYSDYLIILSNNQIQFFDSPNKIIKNPTILNDYGLEIPPPLEICLRLIKRNIFSKNDISLKEKEIAFAIKNKI